MTEQILFLTMLPVGACIGSFLGLLVYRLPRGIPPWGGRSTCETCGVHLVACSLVPVLSFIWQKGRCRDCGASIRWEVLAIELVAMALAGLSAILFSAPGSTLYAAILAWGLLALAWIDAKHFYLPDAIVLPLILVGFAATFWLQPENLPGHVLGAGAGYLSFRCINVLYKILRHRDGLGQGDAKLLALAGAWVGWEVLPWVVLAASILGVLYAFSLLLLGKKDISATMRLPFGTLLAPAIFAAYVFNVLQI